MADSDHTPLPLARRTRPAPRSPSMTIDVTQEIIDTAIPRDFRHCMVADAIRAQFPKFTNVIVDTATSRMTDPDKGLRYIYLTPQIVRNVIYMFDKGDPPPPFSFHLRAAQVRGVRRKDGSKKRMSIESWQKVKEQIQKIRSERGLKWEGIANEMGIAAGTLKARFQDDNIPIVANANKIEKWVLKHTGEKPAPRIKSQAEQASGRTRFRSFKSTKREQPEIIGGAHPPFDVNLAERQFGLRQLQWK